MLDLIFWTSYPSLAVRYEVIRLYMNFIWPVVKYDKVSNDSMPLAHSDRADVNVYVRIWADRVVITNICINKHEHSCTLKAIFHCNAFTKMG